MKTLLIIIALITFFGCKKQDDQGADTCADRPIERIRSSISDFKFKMGTYWVYIDSVTSSIDTMRVTSASENIIWKFPLL